VNPPKMPIHLGDYHRDTGHLRALEHGAYLLLMFHYWSTGGLPNNDDHLATIARLSRSEWKKVKPTLQAFFKDGWRHGRIDYELDKARNISEAAREAGKASGRSRSVKPPLNERSSSVEPTLLPSNHSKKDAADAAPDPEKELFERGKVVLGKGAGGLIAKLLNAKGKNIALARAAIEQASTKSDAREYIGRVINGQKQGEIAWLGGEEGII
jgi:uncharacterized protein YdaU (DUF1376 family)